MIERFDIAGYCRISVDEELDRDNTSIENQKAIISDFVKRQFPDSTLTFYEDRDRSGYTFEQMCIRDSQDIVDYFGLETEPDTGWEILLPIAIRDLRQVSILVGAEEKYSQREITHFFIQDEILPV